MGIWGVSFFQSAQLPSSYQEVLLTPWLFVDLLGGTRIDRLEVAALLQLVIIAAWGWVF